MSNSKAKSPVVIPIEFMPPHDPEFNGLEAELSDHIASLRCAVTALEMSSNVTQCEDATCALHVVREVMKQLYETRTRLSNWHMNLNRAEGIRRWEAA